MDSSDLIIDGAAGLERAVELYDPSKGLRFSTYAYNWIRQAMGTSVIENSRVIRLPSHVMEVSLASTLPEISVKKETRLY